MIEDSDIRSSLDQRPVLVVIAGPNGAGKTTFYEVFLRAAGLRFLNADVLARDLDVHPYDAARLVTNMRRELLKAGESFVLETVFSDPAGEKLSFFLEAVKAGYSVVFCFIGVASVRTSEERVAMRLSQGGHDVPSEKLQARYPRTLANLETAMRELPLVVVFDNTDLRTPFRQLALLKDGTSVSSSKRLPAWFKRLNWA